MSLTGDKRLEVHSREHQFSSLTTLPSGESESAKFWRTSQSSRSSGKGATACQAIQRAWELGPDLVLLDIGMPVLSGLEAFGHIQQLSPQSKILFLTQENDADLQRAVLDAGAEGYVLKADAASELLPKIAAALRTGHRPN